jgi:hypothetical protein
VRRRISRVNDSSLLHTGVPSRLNGKLNSRNRVRQDLLTHRNELLRTSYHANLVSSLDDVNILLSQSADAEIERLRAEVEKIAQVATLIPLDKEVLQTAAVLQGDGSIRRYFDYIVLASVLIEARRSNLEPSCFLNTDHEFSSPEIDALLQNVGCKILLSFDDGLEYLTSQLPR